MNVEVGIVTMTSVDGNIFQGHYYRSVCRSQSATGHKTIRSRFNQESWNFYLRLWKRSSCYKLWLFLHDRFNFCSWYVLSDVSYLKKKKKKGKKSLHFSYSPESRDNLRLTGDSRFHAPCNCVLCEENSVSVLGKLCKNRDQVWTKYRNISLIC